MARPDARYPQRQFGAHDDPTTPGAYTPGEEVGFSDSNVRRKKSLVRPERERIDPNHRQFHYRTQAVQMEAEGRMGVLPSTTGNAPGGLRRGKSLLAREQDVAESGLSLFKRGATLRRKRQPSPVTPSGEKGCFKNIAPGPKDAWMVYSWLITCWIPPFLLSTCGIRTPEQQRAWREKMGLLLIITTLMAGVGFITFGFTKTVCGTPPNRASFDAVGNASLVVNGYTYDFSNFAHPPVSGVFDGKDNPLYDSTFHAAGMDASFLFQNTNQHCTNIIKTANGSVIPNTNGNIGWYFPCNLFSPKTDPTANKTGYDSSRLCHIQNGDRAMFAKFSPSGQVSYSWDDVKDTNRNLAVFESSILDLSLLNWLDSSLISYPPLFDEMKNHNGTFNGMDITAYMYRHGLKKYARCLQDVIQVGFVDSKSIGCVASDVVLYISLIFIIGVVAIKFGMAVIFGWFVSWQLGAYKNESYEERRRRAQDVEQWTDNIYSSAPAQYRPNVNRKTLFFPTTSRFSRADMLNKARPSTTYGAPDPSFRKLNTSSPTSKNYAASLQPPSADLGFRGSRSSTSLPANEGNNSQRLAGPPCPYPLSPRVIEQPPASYEPFNFPLAHTICLVTAYSESIEGLRTTIDSLATTDYPNSHKLILVIADGIVRGSGSAMSTPDVVLSMMKDHLIPKEEVEPQSYEAIAHGHKRHNMAKIYAGFYDYDDNTVEPSKQQRVPMILVAKCGNPQEANEAKPGNRGKRDSQIVLMSFLQKVMMDDRMTVFDYELFNCMWRVTGVCPVQYEIVLCVDADTKVFPDSLTRMVACMVHDEEIMGLCGETKIANKSETWVTMIQVFEYYISHHLTKAFESMFGGVTCLPGCFSTYRIKAPKGDSNFWVPILANPDIINHYAENIVDTLHKKNLLLLGEDRYLTTLMLKTFPKRKMMFCPQAVCKTIVPDTFSVLLSQRRRWINSTVHNLAELVLVRDLCGTFCFSMQFVVFMELAGTLVLPAAISFTIYLIVIAAAQIGPTPVIPLVLLGIILGLPGLLIIITTRKVAYIGWMLIYLISLPIWNFVLPVYAFWHFDDFSWGQTRRVEGDKEGNHGDKEGEFDPKSIIQKRWIDFERERRWNSGSVSRDSYDVIQRKGSPTRNSNRYSMGSTSETYNSETPRPYANYGYDADSPGGSRRPGSDALLVLPTPLSAGRPGRDGSPTGSGSGSGTYSRSNEGEFTPGFTPASYDPTTGSNQQLVIPAGGAEYSPPEGMEPVYRPGGATVRQGTITSGYPGETQNPYRNSQPQSASYFDQARTSATPQTSQYVQDPDDPRNSRGVSLVDPGFVRTEPNNVRRVSKQQQRRSTHEAPSPVSSVSNNPNRRSRGPIPASYSLPPGAAAPNQQGYTR
ncbi:glycosyltransferase family 2 protein [Botryobasidium botryosum FD-172 SS1]|uniref:chitin synthase n=1 Tax=Botryobasidium botryosum (strain FD-172 SS1) TaxID=930990 RepID=A0A067MUW1_BOTB1|nr:glycosyltransferase family 2 protein [Botryobasidium botryosum FD-172 SS1]